MDEKTEQKRERASKLKEKIEEALEGAVLPERLTCCWIEGGDIDGTNYCRRCALRNIRILRSRGQRGLRLAWIGYADSYDSWPHCEDCCRELDGMLTDSGIESEIEHYLEYGSGPIWLSELSQIEDFISDAAYVERLGDDFERFCSWLEQKLDSGKVACPYRVARCKTTMLAVRQASRVCKKKRTSAKKRCPLVQVSLEVVAA